MINHADSQARQRLLQAALKRFAECGYAGASVQEIVDAAGVTKPTLYYYFGNKAGLYHALIDWAADERLRLMQEGAAKGRTLAEKLTEIITAQFEFVCQNRDLTRLGFATAFAASGEVPEPVHCLNRARRNFEFFHGLVRAAQASGQLARDLSSEELAMGIFGMMNFHVMAHLVVPKRLVDRGLAKRLVQLFLAGAGRRNDQ
jgi:AcrR family transcriptional regulator